MGFYHCDEATQFNTISHLQKIPLFDIAHFGTIYRHVSIRHDCKNKIVCEKAEYLLLLPPLRSILLSAKFLFKFRLSSFEAVQFTDFIKINLSNVSLKVNMNCSMVHVKTPVTISCVPANGASDPH